MIAQVVALEGVRLRTALNVLRRGGPSLWLLLSGGLLLLLAFLYGEYRFFLRVFDDLGRVGDFPRFFVIGILERLHGMVFLTAMSMLLFSNVLTGVSTTYLATDLTLLHSSPVRRGALFSAKLLETMLLSSYMVWLVTVPLFVAFGKAYGSAPRTALWSLGVLLLYAVPPAALGAMAALLLMRFVPARRAHQVLTGLGVLGAVLLVVLLRALKPEQLLNPGSADDLVALLASINVGTSATLPSSWAATAIVSSLQGLAGVYGRQMAKLALLSVGLLAALALAVDASYFRAYARSSEGAPRSRPRGARRPVDRLWEILLLPASVPGRALYLKDVRVFARDSVQWSQMLLIGALVFVYLFNIRNLPLVHEFPYLSIIVSYLNLGLTAFILAAISVRYAFPAVSLEGQAYWVIRSAPVDPRRLLWSKFVLHLVPFLVLAETLVVLGQLLLSPTRYLFLLAVATTAALTVGLTGLGVGLGAMMPRFRFESAAQVAAGSGGITFMVLALALIGLVQALLTVPVYQYISEIYPHFDLLRYKTLPTWPFYTAVGVVCALSALVPLRLGLARLRVLDA